VGGREGRREGGRGERKMYIFLCVLRMIILPSYYKQVLETTTDKELLRKGGREGGREGGRGQRVGRSENIFGEVGGYGCQNNGLGELDTMVREGAREGGREGRREGTYLVVDEA
jgi:hypothetical protein